MEIPSSKFNAFGNFFRPNKDRSSKNSLHFDSNSIHNKENVTDSSYQDKADFKTIPHSNYQARPRSLDIRVDNQLHVIQNRNNKENLASATPLADFDRFFNSPKGVEAELLRTQEKSLYNQTMPSQINKSGMKKDEKNSKYEYNSMSQPKIDQYVNSSMPLRHDTSSPKVGLANTQPIPDRTSEKLTLYTRLLNEMKTMTLKSPEPTDLEPNGLSYKAKTTPSDEPKLKSLDPKRPYLDLKIGSVNTLKDKDAQNNAREDPKPFNSLSKTFSLAKRGAGSDENARPREMTQKQQEQANTKDSKYQRQERPSFSKKALNPSTYVNSEPDYEERPSTTKAMTTKGKYNNNNQNGYESLTNCRRIIDKPTLTQNYFSSTVNLNSGPKENNTPSSNKNSTENVREAKPIFKSFTPKANTMTPSEVKKVLQSFQKTSQLEKPGSSKLQNNAERSSSSVNRRTLDDDTYQKYLRQGVSKNEERPNTTGSSLQHKSSASVKTLKYRDSSLSSNKKQEYQPSKIILTEENEEGKQKEKPSQSSLKDFITQVNPGSMPIKSKNEAATRGNERPSFAHLQPQSVKNSTKPVLHDRQLAGSGLFNMNKTSNTVTHSSIAQEMKSFSFNTSIENKNSRRSIRNNEERSGSIDLGARKEGKAASAVCEYYMAGIEIYLKKSSVENEYFSKIYREHFLQGYQAINFCKYLKPVDPLELAKKKVYLPRRETHKDKKTIIFDLDETLIHCNENSKIPSDVVLPVKFPHGDIIEAGINIRPHAVEALQELSKQFEIIVFTASHSCYANVVLDHLDPENKYIHHRLFRESCVTTEEGLYVKDLRIFANRNLKDLVIVDNAMYSFGYQLENGIPIIPYYYNKADKELITLVKYLKGLEDAKDVRDFNIRSFKLHIFAECESQEEVLQKLFE